jgi:hypothetical protein
MTSRRAGVFLRLLIFFGTVLPNVSFSQTAGGTILGAVKDPQGAAVPEASVTISNNATGVTRAVLTDFDLQVGSVNETVEVSAQESTVDNPGAADFERRADYVHGKRFQANPVRAQAQFLTSMMKRTAP